MWFQYERAIPPTFAVVLLLLWVRVSITIQSIFNIIKTKYRVLWSDLGRPEPNSYWIVGVVSPSRAHENRGWYLYRDSRQTCAAPPSTNNSMPVTKLESSEARNTATLAISSALPMRPIGMVATI